MAELAPFEQIADHFRRRIEDGEISPGERLPTVRQIAEQWQVARQTVGRAIELLKEGGYVTTGGRAGTVVLDPEVTSITVALDGIRTPGLVVADIRPAGRETARELGIELGSAIVVLRLPGRKSAG